MIPQDKTRAAHGIAYILGGSAAIFGVVTGIDPFLWWLCILVTGLMIVAGGLHNRALQAERELDEIASPEFAAYIRHVVDRARVVRGKRDGAA